MQLFEREVNGHRYRIAAQSVWDAQRGRSVARQVVLGPAEPPPLADLRATQTVGTRGVGDVGALIWVAEQLDLVAHIDRACPGAGAEGGPSWRCQEQAQGSAGRRAWRPGQRDGARATAVSDVPGQRLGPIGARGVPGWIGAVARGTRQRRGSRAAGAAHGGARWWVLEPA